MAVATPEVPPATIVSIVVVSAIVSVLLVMTARMILKVSTILVSILCRSLPKV